MYTGFLAQHVVLFSQLHCLPVQQCLVDAMHVKISKISMYVVDNSNVHVALIMLASCVLGMMFL